MTEIILTDYEFKAAVDLANARMFAGNEQRLKHATTYARTYIERLTEEVVGACGETAFAKYANIYFSPTYNTFHGVADAGGCEVRTTELSHGSLIVRSHELEDGLLDRWFCLVTGTPPVMNVRGFIRGYNAKRDEWVRDPNGHNRPAWFVPQSALIPARKKHAIDGIN